MSAYPNQPTLDVQKIERALHQIFPILPIHVERVATGISTYVYRIAYRNELFYLRILPEAGASFAPEVAVHTRLHQMGVKVPEVIHFEEYNDILHCSIMVTTEIKGQPVSQLPALSQQQAARIVMEAGQDLARINSVPVEGFGWVERERPDTTRLQADMPTFRSFALEFWQADLAYLAQHAITAVEVALLERVLARCDAWLDVEHACLAHGDLDATHVYQQDGQYRGIIDFGEIRGADRWYDLAHFHMRDGEELPYHLTSSLVYGYGEIAALPSDYEQHIRFTSLLINVRTLARSLQTRPPNQYTQHQLVVLREDLKALL